MLFEKRPPISLLPCSTCKSTGRLGVKKCPECAGMSVGYSARGKWLYWDYPLTRFHLALQRGRRWLDKIRFVTFLVLGINFWVWLGFAVYKNHNYKILSSGPEYIWDFILSFTSSMQFLFWLGVSCFVYLFYRSVREKKKKGEVERYQYQLKKSKDLSVADWKKAKKISRRNRLSIADSFTVEALSALGQAYVLADKNNHISVAPPHLFYALLNSNRISNIFIRLGILTNTLKQKMEPMFANSEKTKTKDSGSMPLLSPDLWQILFKAYEEAYGAHQEYVSVTELLLVSVQESPELQEILYDLGVDKNKLLNVVEWARIRERLHRQYLKLRKASKGRSKNGMDKAMTALATPYLNSLSEDITIKAQFGQFEECVARETETEEIFRVVQGGQMNVLLVGDHGIGKRSIVEGIAGRMVADDVPERLYDKRLVKLSLPSLLAGTTPAGAVERLIAVMNEIARARNVILFINNIHDLMGVSTGGEGGGLDVSETLAEYLRSGKFFTIATTTTEEYAKHLSRSNISGVFTNVVIKEMNENQAIQVLESRAGYVEYKQNVFFSYDAIAKCVQLAKRFLHESFLPGSALEVMTEAASHARAKKGVNSLVSAEEVAVVVAEKTKIPVTSVGADESEKLMRLETEMHKKVIGQDEAVNLVGNALRRARAEIRPTNKPISNFLFLGPTGVGKTELAKTIASVYFGGEERMLRFDMSEYQDKASIYRLIGSAGEQGTGVLTEAVRRNPFALLLLDEIEKADKDIINLFLQVMDDGRLTDSTGRVVDFTNVILVATSNAGTSFVQEQMRAGISSDAIKDRLMHGELKQYFRPEFLNRFDGIVLFKALAKEDIKKIAALMLKRVAKDLENKGIELVVEEAAIDYLADVGFDPEFGARPMRRAIQERVENKLAEFLISGQARRGNKIVVGEGGKITIE